ncbi:Expansin-A7 [Carex littledalei]|uniref:Expansin n=1 Tax=Carex littledalei TaxID=544730 RepID=A0A833QKP7_9POAL|nr:Expansin-A7 [Carex littledalei]
MVVLRSVRGWNRTSHVPQGSVQEDRWYQIQVLRECVLASGDPLNVAGAGDIGAMSVKGSKTCWIQMSQNWGVMWQAFSNLGGQALSFQIQAGSSSDTIICNNVADAYWGVSYTYQSYNNF